MQNDYGDGDIFFSIILEKTRHTYNASSVANFNTLAGSEMYPLSFDCNFISTYYVDWSPMFSVGLNNAPNFYMKIGIDNFTSMISECPSGCTLCGSNGKCKTCSSEFYLFHETCLGCDSSCVNCKELSFNCSLCPNLIQMVKYSNTFVNYEICENCELPGCKVCLHNVCLICADQFTLIKNDCIDCTKQKNKKTRKYVFLRKRICTFPHLLESIGHFSEKATSWSTRLSRVMTRTMYYNVSLAQKQN